MENSGEFPSPEIQKNRSIEATISFRKNQTTLDRLCEYITGLNLNSEKLINRLTEDQKIIREKYSLPDREYKFTQPVDYENYLKELAKTNGVNIRERSDCGSFFKNTVLAGAVYLSDERTIGVDIDKSSDKSYFSALGNLEHETIHSLQDKLYPQMPIEIQEYEAYVANFNIDYLKNNPDAIELIFDFTIKNSADRYYKDVNEEKGVNIKPIWNNPEYFLKNIDGISESEIEKYRKEKLEAKELDLQP